MGRRLRKRSTSERDSASPPTYSRSRLVHRPSPGSATSTSSIAGTICRSVTRMVDDGLDQVPGVAVALGRAMTRRAPATSGA